MHLLRAAHFQVLGLVVSFRDFVYKRLFNPRVQAKQNLQTLSLFGDLYSLYYILWISSHQYYESLLKIHEHLSNNALSAIPRAASPFHVLFINPNLNIENHFALLGIDLSRLDQIKEFLLFWSGKKRLDVNNDLITI